MCLHQKNGISLTCNRPRLNRCTCSSGYCIGSRCISSGSRLLLVRRCSYRKLGKPGLPPRCKRSLHDRSSHTLPPYLGDPALGACHSHASSASMSLIGYGTWLWRLEAAWDSSQVCCKTHRTATLELVLSTTVNSLYYIWIPIFNGISY